MATPHRERRQKPTQSQTTPQIISLPRLRLSKAKEGLSTDG